METLQGESCGGGGDKENNKNWRRVMVGCMCTCTCSWDQLLMVEGIDEFGRIWGSIDMISYIPLSPLYI